MSVENRSAETRRIHPKLHKRLEGLLLYCNGSTGMYPGDHWDSASKQYSQLERMGLVETFVPWNPVHKTRAVITDAGRAYLKEQGNG